MKKAVQVGRSEATHISKVDGNFYCILDIVDYITDDILNESDYTSLAKKIAPNEVPLWSFRAVLIEDNLFQSFYNYLVANNLTKLVAFIEYGNTIQMNCELIQRLKTACNKTDEDINDIFYRAGNITY